MPLAVQSTVGCGVRPLKTAVGEIRVGGRHPLPSEVPRLGPRI